MMLEQETGVLVAEPFVCLIMLGTPLKPLTFVSRRRRGLLLYHLQQMVFLE